MLQGGFHLFSIRGIPVYFSPIFLLALGWIGLSDFSVESIIWIVVLTVSILVHEMGHALVARYYRLSPTITLHGWGGLTHHEHPDRELHDVLIIIAGPGAGLILGALSLAFLMFGIPALAPANSLLATAVWYLVWVNIVWSFVNLLPLWPLDGGNLFRLGMVKLFGGLMGERITHVVGAVVGAATAYLTYYPGFPLFAVLCGYWTVLNVLRINSRSATGPMYVQNRFAKGLAKKMMAAYGRGDYDEAYRLGQQIRSEPNLDSGTLGKCWEVLGVVAAIRDDYEEAWSYLKRAPERGRVLEARAACIIALELRDEARTFLATEKQRKTPRTSAGRIAFYRRNELSRFAERDARAERTSFCGAARRRRIKITREKIANAPGGLAAILVPQRRHSVTHLPELTLE